MTMTGGGPGSTTDVETSFKDEVERRLALAEVELLTLRREMDLLRACLQAATSGHPG